MFYWFIKNTLHVVIETWIATHNFYKHWINRVGFVSLKNVFKMSSSKSIKRNTSLLAGTGILAP